MANLFQFGGGGAVTPPPATVNAPTAIAGTYNPAFGGIPAITDPVSSTGSAVTGDTSQLGSVGTLTTGTAGANAAGAAAQYQANLPQYNDLIGQSSSDILSNLNGVLPPDVMNLISQQGAERGIATGSPESPNSDAAFLQSLGLTSLGLESTGQTQLNSAVARTPVGPQVNAQNYQTTPTEEQQASQLQSELLAAPIPADANQANANAAAAGRAAGAGAVNPPANPALPQPLYAGQQNTSTAGYPPVGGASSQQVQQLISQGFTASDIQQMTPDELAYYTSPANSYNYIGQSNYGSLVPNDPNNVIPDNVLPQGSVDDSGY